MDWFNRKDTVNPIGQSALPRDETTNSRLKTLLIVNVMTFLVLCYAAPVAIDRSSDGNSYNVAGLVIQALFAAALCASILGLLFTVLLLPSLSSKPLLKHRSFRIVLLVIDVAVLLFLWFTFWASSEYWFGFDNLRSIIMAAPNTCLPYHPT